MKWLPVLLLSVFFLGACAPMQPAQQGQVKIYVVEQSNIKYSLFSVDRDGKISILPILEKITFPELPRRFFWKVSLKKSNRAMSLVRAFVRTPKVKGERIIGSLTGFENSEAIIEIDLPLDLTNQPITAWFVVEATDGRNIASKKINFTVGGSK